MLCCRKHKINSIVGYCSVMTIIYYLQNEFVDDMVRVLQGALTRAQYHGSKAVKQIQAVKKLFEQEVAQLFPWCEVHKSGLWEYNLCLPK